jgi:hypothetical protein
MTFSHLTKVLIVTYVAIVFLLQSCLFLVEKFIDNNFVRVEAFTGNITKMINYYERLAFLVALGMIENPEVFPHLKNELKVRGVGEYASIVDQIIQRRSSLNK